MPEAPLTPERRHVEAPDDARVPARAAFVELGLVSCFSFLRGASDAVDLALQAHKLGYDALGIADVNSMAGVVRLHTETRALHLRPVIGCRIETVEGLTFLAYPADRDAYGRLCALISAGRMGKLDGEWQDKGVCEISLAMLAGHAHGVHLVLVPPRDLDARFAVHLPGNVVPLNAQAAPDGAQHAFLGALEALLPHLAQLLSSMRHLAVTCLHAGQDVARISRLDAMAREHGLSILATNDVLYDTPERRPLHDVMTAIRHRTTVAQAGWALEANGERHLKSPQEMQRLFARWPHAIKAARDLADACVFSLEELQYEYPEEICPGGIDPQARLEALTEEGAQGRYPRHPGGMPQAVRETLVRELELIGKLRSGALFPDHQGHR